MQYAPQIDKVAISNYEKLIFADPYTLKSAFSFSIPKINSIHFIQETNYVILTTYYNVLQIFDVKLQKIVLTMDNSKQLETFPDQYYLFQYYSVFYKLKSGDTIVVTTNEMGLIYWGLDVENLTYTFYGYIQDSKIPKGYVKRSFTKHPEQDIIFMGGRYLEFIAVKIIDVKTGQFSTLFNKKLYDGTYDDYITNLEFSYYEQDGVNYPLLWGGDTYYLYYTWMGHNEDYTQMEIQNFDYYEVSNSYKWYKLEESPVIIISGRSYITLVNVQTLNYLYNLYFYGNSNSRRFIRQADNLDLVILMNDDQTRLYEKGNFGYSYSTQKPALSQKIRNYYSSSYKVKGCEECLFFKSGENKHTNYILTTLVYPFNQQDLPIDITNTYGLSWEDINLNLDPFYLRDSVWVALAFPNKSTSDDYLFQLINCYSQNERYFLKSDNSNFNQRSTAYVVASLYDPDNLELIGVDNAGTVYVWDLSTQNFDFKFSVNFNFCQNSLIGDVFHQDKLKRLIISCDDNKIYSLDYQNNQSQFLIKQTIQPLALKAFSDSSLVAIGEFNTGEAQIFKFNTVTKMFEFFLQLQASSVKDSIIYIEMLKDKTIWIQYSFSNIFYSIQDCLSDSKLCTQCTQSYYFSATNEFDNVGIYGKGVEDNPFTSSDNFITSMIKAQYYKELVNGVSNMSVDIITDPKDKLNLNPRHMNFDFTSIITLTFKSKEAGNYASLLYQNTLELQNFNFIGFKDIIIYFGLDNGSSECGINLINIKQSAVIDNIQLYPIFSTKSCQSIYADHTILDIKKYEITDHDFTNHETIIKTFNVDKISISNLVLKNSILGESFSILNQESNLNAIIDNLTISENRCPDSSLDNELISSLFSAGSFQVTNLIIQDNTFCKKIIFTTMVLLAQDFQTFSFSELMVQNNIFQSRTTYIFFNALYSMRSNPSHEVVLNKVTFINNKLVKKFEQDLEIAQLFQTHKIKLFQADNIILQNHFDIQFALIEYANSVSFNNFSCINEEEYFNNIPDQTSSGCLQMNEIKDVIINEIKIIKKKAFDKSIFIMENYVIQLATLKITDGEFKDLQLIQNESNTDAIPFYIGSNFKIEMELDNCHFENINLQCYQYSLTYSSTALWVQNFVGSVLIKNSSFKNSYSTSLYGFIYVQSNELTLQNVQFDKSTFPDNPQQLLFYQDGGMINVKAQKISIKDSTFSQATASRGSFLFLMAFGKQLIIDISNTKFIEGYANLDGGAIFIDTVGQYLSFNCLNCEFTNIYTITSSASAIGLEYINFQIIWKPIIKLFILQTLRKYTKNKSEENNEINFEGGEIQNIFGFYDNYFIDVIKTNIYFKQVTKITSFPFSSDSLAHSFYIDQHSDQQATLVNLQKSNLNIIDCNFLKLEITNIQASYPLLISAKSSTVIVENADISDCKFITNVINASQSDVVLTKVNFKQINQKNKNNRLLQQDIYNTPSDSTNSLIYLSQSTISIGSNSEFSDITCIEDCNGGALQILQGILSIEDTIFQNIQSTFGGAIYVQGLNGTNVITNTKFLDSKSDNDGGAIYFNALKNDKFSLEVKQSIFQGNAAYSRGGAIFVQSEVLNSIDQIFNLIDSQIINNNAKIGGGIQQYNLAIDISKNNLMQGNSGSIYGDDSVSYPSKLKIQNIDQFLKQNLGQIDNDHIVINNIRSGANLTNIVFLFMNDKNEIIYPVTSEEYDTYEIKVRFSPDTKSIKSYTLSGDISIKFDAQLQKFYFTDLTVIGIPGTSAVLQFYSDQIYVLNQKTYLFEQTYNFNMLLNFRNCGPGEQITTLSQITQCEICPEGKFSYHVEDCQECPLGATCSGGDNLITKAGYWRKTNESTLVIQCNNLLENCVGGTYGDHICYEGHIGALCEECDIYGSYWGISYSKSAKYSCTRCDQIKNNLWIVGLMTIWTLISMTLAIKGDVDVLKEKVAVLTIQKNLRRRQPALKPKDKTQTTMNSIQRKSISVNQRIRQYSVPQNQNQQKLTFSSDEDKSGILIKMLTNYLQIVGSIATFNLSIPSGIFEFPQSIGQPLKQTMNSLDCALQQMDTSIPIIYLRLIFSLIIPILYMVIFLIGMLVFFFIQKEKKFQWYILSTAIMFLIIYVQPDLVAQIIALISCRRVGDTNYILSNVSFECFTSEHYFYALILIIPLLLVWVFILPLILFLMLRRNKHQLDNIDIKLKYGFLYKEYQNYAFYWEFIKMAEKIAIILSLNFYSQSIITKGILVFIIITSYAILSLIIHPYQERDINEIDVNSTNVCALTVLLGLFMYNNEFPYFLYTSLVLIVIINVWFIVKILRKIIGGYATKIQSTLITVCTLLSSKIKCFKRFIGEEKKKKAINPILKQKFQRVFKKYLDFTPKEKKIFIMKVLESQLLETHYHIFGEEDEEEMVNQKQQLKDQMDNSILIQQQNQILQENNQQTKCELLQQQLDTQNNIKYSENPILIEMQDENACKIFDSNAKLMQMKQSPLARVAGEYPSSNFATSRQKSPSNEVIQEEQIEVDIQEGQNQDQE